MLHDFVTSKKVLAAVLTVGANAFIKDDAMRAHATNVGEVLIAAIAAADIARARALNPTAPTATANVTVEK